MTKRLPCPPAPGPLEAYFALVHERLQTLAQRRGLRGTISSQQLMRMGNCIPTGPRAARKKGVTLISPRDALDLLD
jgi:hypothetical protein